MKSQCTQPNSSQEKDDLVFKKLPLSLSVDGLKLECWAQVELFVLSVPCGGSQVRKRRVELLRKHVERIKITSNVDVEQPPELQLENIRWASTCLLTSRLSML